MDQDRFVTVFNVLDSGFKSWIFSAFGLIFVAVGLVLVFWPRIIRATGIAYLSPQSSGWTFFRYSFFGFAVLWTIGAFTATYLGHRQHRALVLENKCRVVEGMVENFVPMPPGGRAAESFSVAGVQFSYSDFMITDGFNHTSSRGGPINKDSYVRICYDPVRNVILHLAIRDFTREAIDDSKRSQVLPSREQIPRDRLPPRVPWYANLFVLAAVLDFVAIAALFRPYLKTFLPVKVTSLNDPCASAALADGAEMKLRTSVVYRDAKDRTIWLRPRGFVLAQIPSTIAKLTTDASDTSVVEVEIRFSPVSPVAVALFLWAVVYGLLSAAIPAGGLSIAAAAGIIATFFCVAGFFQLRMLRPKMERLVQDALAELDARSRQGL